MSYENLMTLTMLQHHLRKFIPRELLNADVRVLESFYVDGMLEIITRFEIPSDAQKRLTYPDGWFEAVKDRFLPKILKRIIPIKRVVIDINRIFPELPDDAIKMLGRPRTSILIQTENETECES